MKEGSGPSIFKHNPKKEIIYWARNGIFDRNPLLAASHQVVCKACGFSQKITYLDYLKTGRFELRKTRMIEVSHAAPTISGLKHIVERITPIIVRFNCERCGTEMSCSPVSLEYLFFTATREQKLKNMYI